jgi:very-short-patch-repair endonuclease
VPSPLCSLGHVATTAELERAGLGRRERASLIPALAYKPRRGVFACSHLDSLDRLAVSCRARLDCIAVLRAEGVWTGHYRGVHLRLTRGDRHGAPRVQASVKHAKLHWDRDRFPGTSRTRVTVQEALFCAMRCLPAEDLMAAIESAVHLKKVSPAQALAVIRAAPRRLKAELASVDTRFRAQSGYETKVRLRLERAGHRVEPQFYVAGVGHLDNLVDEVVAVETDGAQHRDSLEEDHRRDLGTEAAGIRVLRIDPGLVDRNWELVLRVIERMIREAKHPSDTDPGRRRRRAHE